MTAQSVGLFGGTFDPIHIGHVIIARSLLEQLHWAELIFVPSAQPPHKGGLPLTDFTHRAEMLRLAIEDEPGLDLDTCESERQGPSYTLDTVAHFHKERGPEAELSWIIGADSLVELHTWYRVGELVESCNIVTACRPGWDQPDLSGLERQLSSEQLAKVKRGILETPRIDMSSTDIRRRVAAGKSIRYLVPEAVRRYINDHQLYR